MAAHVPATTGHEPWHLWPRTRLGLAAVVLGVGMFVLQGMWTLLGPLGGFPSLVSGLAGGVLAIVDLRRGHRSYAVAAMLVPLALVVFFIAGELLIGHD